GMWARHKNGGEMVALLYRIVTFTFIHVKVTLENTIFESNLLIFYKQRTRIYLLKWLPFNGFGGPQSLNVISNLNSIHVAFSLNVILNIFTLKGITIKTND
ncbi:hypothetical protein ACJX0J_025167, partial [Zea mays]